MGDRLSRKMWEGVWVRVLLEVGFKGRGRGLG